MDDRSGAGRCGLLTSDRVVTRLASLRGPATERRLGGGDAQPSWYAAAGGGGRRGPSGLRRPAWVTRRRTSGWWARPSTAPATSTFAVLPGRPAYLRCGAARPVTNPPDPSSNSHRRDSGRAPDRLHHQYINTDKIGRTGLSPSGADNRVPRETSAGEGYQGQLAFTANLTGPVRNGDEPGTTRHACCCTDHDLLTSCPFRYRPSPPSAVTYWRTLLFDRAVRLQRTGAT